jgi:hypothetical protein
MDKTDGSPGVLGCRGLFWRPLSSSEYLRMSVVFFSPHRGSFLLKIHSRSLHVGGGLPSGAWLNAKDLEDAIDAHLET